MKHLGRFNLSPIAAAHGSPEAGDFYVQASDGLLRGYDGSGWRNYVTTDGAQALTNKTINATLNTITNIGFAALDTPLTDTLKLSVGMTLDEPSVAVTSNGTTVTLALERVGGGDLRLLFSDGPYTFDCTPAATIALTAGTDAAPQRNYIFIPQSTKVLTVNTTGFPTASEHVPVADVLVQSAADVQADGPYKLTSTIDHTYNGDHGHLAHVNTWIRSRFASWISGVAPTVSGSGTSTVQIEFSSGVALSLHDVSLSAIGTGVNKRAINHPTTPYLEFTNLAALTVDSTGASLTGKSYALVFWGSISEQTNACQIFCNLPSGSYQQNHPALARADASRFTNYSIPREYQGAAFLICRVVLSNNGSVWTVDTDASDDLRGQIPNVAPGASAPLPTTFVDTAFRIIDNADDTRILAFEAGSITPGNTRTLTVPDASGAIVITQAGATDEAIARFDGATGRILQNSAAYINDAGDFGIGAAVLASTRVRITGQGTTTAVGLRVESSVNALNLAVRDDGKVDFRNWGVPIANGAPGQVLTSQTGGQATWETPAAGSSPPGTGYLQGSVGTSSRWLKYLVNNEGDVMTDDLYQIVHEVNTGAGDVAHGEYTTTEGIHSVVAKQYASASARTTDTTLVAADVGKVALQTDNTTLWVLADESPLTWVELTNSQISVVKVVADSIIATQNDYNPGTWTSDTQNQQLYLTPTGPQTITGLAGGVDGRHASIYNASTVATDVITITHADLASAAGNRFDLAGGVSFVIPSRASIELVYDGPNGVWRTKCGQGGVLLTGTTAGTIARGDDSRFNKNGETLYDVLQCWHPHRTVATLPSNHDPFVLASVLAGGTFNNASYPVTDAMADGRNLPVTMRSSATANSGCRIYTENLSWVCFPSAGQVFTCRFMMASTATNITARMGFHDATASADAVDGCYIEVSSGTLKGKTSANSVRSTTATTFTYAANTWYTANIYTDGFDSVTFDLLDDAGVSVWSDMLAISTPDNVPELIARAMAVAFVITCSAVAATNLGVVSIIQFGTQSADYRKTVG